VSAHTPEPWFATPSRQLMVFVEARIGGGLIQEVATCMNCRVGEPAANAARIVACVNACTGMADPATEIDEGKQALAYVPALTERMLEAESLRHSLLTALKGVVSILDNDDEQPHDKRISLARAVIAKASQ